jgi:hypothetical protein
MNRPEFKAVTMLSDEADEPSRTYLKTFNDWKLYREDIKTRRSSRPEPGNATWLGCFTYTRDQQLAIPDRCIGSHTSEGTGQMSSDDTLETTEGWQQRKSEQVLSNTRSHDASEELADSTPSLTSSTPLSRVVSAHSEHSAVDPKMAPGIFTQSPGEDYINIAAVTGV